MAHHKVSSHTLKIILWLAVLSLSCYLLAHSRPIYLKKFTFDEDKTLDKWNRMVLNGRVDYELIKTGNNGFIKAYSDKACSALYQRIGFKLEDYPFLTWKWQVLKFPDLSNAKNQKEKDDYAARVYVVFPFLNFSSSKFIEYVWAQDLSTGTIMDSPLAGNVKIIVARSGSLEKGEWAQETRNVYDDYVKAFGKKPQRGVGAIAIMCDADSSKTQAESLFDDIIIER